MSFIQNDNSGTVYAPGFFLAHEECTRVTREIPQSMATNAANGTKYVPMGTPYPSNDNACVGFIYEDVDVTTGNMAGSVVTAGTVYESRIPVNIDTNAKAALVNSGFSFVNVPTVNRPY